MPNDYLLGEKLRVFVLFSGGASSGLGLVEGTNHGKTYEVVGAGTNNTKACGIDEIEKKLKIKPTVLDYVTFCNTLGIDPADKDSNIRYHDEWLSSIEPFKPHVIALSGYFRIVTKNFLQEYPDTKNVHPMTLHYLTQKTSGTTNLYYNNLVDVGNIDPVTVKDSFDPIVWKRAFKGESAVFDAIVFGYDTIKLARPVREIRSTVHRAVEKYDEGPIEVESAPIQIDEEYVARMLQNRNFGEVMEYSKKLQNELKVKGDIPAFRKAIELTAERRLEHRDGVVYIDGVRMPYKGLQLTE